MVNSVILYFKYIYFLEFRLIQVVGIVHETEKLANKNRNPRIPVPFLLAKTGFYKIEKTETESKPDFQKLRYKPNADANEIAHLSRVFSVSSSYFIIGNLKNGFWMLEFVKVYIRELVTNRNLVTNIGRNLIAMLSTCDY